MPKITDRVLLNLDTEISVNTSTNRIGLSIAGNLDVDGVRKQAIFGFLLDLWQSSAVYSFYPFPMKALAVDQYELVGWDWLDNATRSLLRDGGYAVSVDGTITQEWLCALSGSGVSPGAQLYYELTGAKVNFARTGEANEVIQTFKTGTGAFDNRTAGLTLFAREWGRTYAMSSLAGQGVTSADYKSYLLPLQTDVDINITELEADVASDSPFTGVTLTILPGSGFTTWNSSTSYAINDVVSRLGRWYRATTANTNSQPPDANWTAFEGEKEVDGVYYPFTKIFSNSANASINQVYHKERYLFRQNSDIDSGSGTLIGALADPLMRYVGSTLFPGESVWIENVPVGDRQSVIFEDGTGAEVAYQPVLRLFGLPNVANVIIYVENLANNEVSYPVVSGGEAAIALDPTASYRLRADAPGYLASDFVTISGATTREYQFDLEDYRDVYDSGVNRSSQILFNPGTFTITITDDTLQLTFADVFRTIEDYLASAPGLSYTAHPYPVILLDRNIFWFPYDAIANQINPVRIKPDPSNTADPSLLFEVYLEGAADTTYDLFDFSGAGGRVIRVRSQLAIANVTVSGSGALTLDQDSKLTEIHESATKPVMR